MRTVAVREDLRKTREECKINGEDESFIPTQVMFTTKEHLGKSK